MDTLDRPTDFVSTPIFVGCDYSIQFGSRYSFKCYVLVEERLNEHRNRFKDLRLYPLTEEGHKSAEEDLQAIEAFRRKLGHDERLKKMRIEIDKKQCQYCLHYPKQKTELKGLGSFYVCQRTVGKDGERSMTLCGIPSELLIYDSSSTCENFLLADKYKNI